MLQSVLQFGVAVSFLGVAVGFTVGIAVGLQLVLPSVLQLVLLSVLRHHLLPPAYGQA